MALTKIGTDGVKDDAVTSDKVANAINSAIAANTAKTSLEDESVTLAKLEHGTSSNDGKFLRANNGADPSFETVTSTNIIGNADNRVITGSGTANTLEGESNLTYDGSTLKINAGLLEVAHSSCHVDFMETGTTNHRLRNGSGNFHIQRISDDKSTETTQFDIDGGTGAVSLYHDGSKKCETNSTGASVTGYLTQSALPSACVYGAGSWTSISSSSNINPLTMFSGTAHNVGSMYNNSTGKMTAPVAGIYHILINLFCQGLTNSDSQYNSLEVYLKKNGGTLSRHHNKIGYGNVGDDQQVMSLNCVEDLAVNDEISVYVGAGGGGNWQIYGAHSNFQMTLLG